MLICHWGPLVATGWKSMAPSLLMILGLWTRKRNVCIKILFCWGVTKNLIHHLYQRSNSLLLLRLPGCGACRRTVQPWTTTSSAALCAITMRRESCRRYKKSPLASSLWKHVSTLSTEDTGDWFTYPSMIGPYHDTPIRKGQLVYLLNLLML